MRRGGHTLVASSTVSGPGFKSCPGQHRECRADALPPFPRIRPLRFRPHVLSRRTHKWFALIVGVQAVIWTLSGLYMTAVHIDIIHGDHFVGHEQPRPVAAAQLASPAAVAVTSKAGSVKLAGHLQRPAYIAKTPTGDLLFDAATGQRLSAPSRDQIQQLAERYFTGSEKLERLSLITVIPGEIRGRKPPLWRADFSGWNKPTLYLSPATGELVSRRHELWRVFDFVWMLHIMDYDERENINNWLLRTFTWLAIATALSGAWLLWFAFARRRRKAAVK